MMISFFKELRYIFLKHVSFRMRHVQRVKNWGLRAFLSALPWMMDSGHSERPRHQSSSARSARSALHSTEFLQEGSSDHARHCAKHLGNLGETRIKQ